jgi:hypothetical protein
MHRRRNTPAVRLVITSERDLHQRRLRPDADARLTNAVRHIPEPDHSVAALYTVAHGRASRLRRGALDLAERSPESVFVEARNP